MAKLQCSARPQHMLVKMCNLHKGNKSQRYIPSQLTTHSLRHILIRWNKSSSSVDILDLRRRERSALKLEKQQQLQRL
jgi:hypothetical protein